jgi:hypothetical protein
MGWRWCGDWSGSAGRRWSWNGWVWRGGQARRRGWEVCGRKRWERCAGWALCASRAQIHHQRIRLGRQLGYFEEQLERRGLCAHVDGQRGAHGAPSVHPTVSVGSAVGENGVAVVARHATARDIRPRDERCAAESRRRAVLYKEKAICCSSVDHKPQSGGCLPHTAVYWRQMIPGMPR